MSWHHVNALNFENATHRARLVTAHGEKDPCTFAFFWMAERKACCDEHATRIPGRFATLDLAKRACDRDASSARDRDSQSIEA